MASSAAEPPSTRVPALQIRLGAARAGLEAWLEAERDQIVLWMPVMLGLGITLWFVLLDQAAWKATMLLCGAVACGALAVGQGGRAARAIAVGALAVAVGLGLIWWRAERVASVVLTRPTIAAFEARVESIEPLVARGLVRLRLAPTKVDSAPLPGGEGLGVGGSVRYGEAGDAGAGHPDPTHPRPLPFREGSVVALPAVVRVNLEAADVPPGLTRGAIISLRARLMPPPEAAVPGAYDYARTAWFDRIGGTGRGFAPVAIVTPGEGAGSDLRGRLAQHIQSRIAGSAGGIAAALAMGDEGAITEADSEAMRRSGLAHLLSVSGLHITAAVALVMFVVLRLLALSPWLALHVRLPLVAAAAGAAAAIGYTLLTGNQVPTFRSCVAALLVLVALAMGREAMTLRLVAAGALVVLLFWPEALAGPSFQLSFAAIASIVSLHDHPRIAAWFGPHDEGRFRRIARELCSLLLTGLVVELALMPIAFFHFHKAGLYGALANIVAIPLTTFVIMPLEAGALLFDAVGFGAPWWWLTDWSLRLLLWIARTTAGLPGSVAALPAMPGAAYALMVGGGLWLALWRTRWRRLGLVPLAAGVLWALLTPAPDLLVTGDGRHIAVRTADGDLAMLRDRTGDYTASLLAENGGIDGTPLLLADQPNARCNRDLCLAERVAGGRTWRILATRSAYMVSVREFVAACREADIVVSERRLPRGCAPRWLRLDRGTLAKTGGVAVALASGEVRTVRRTGDAHPWRVQAGVTNRPNRISRAHRRSYASSEYQPGDGRDPVGKVDVTKGGAR